MTSSTPDPTLADLPALDDREMESVLSEAVPPTLDDGAIPERMRTQFLDLLGTPRGGIDRSAYVWEELSPGLKFHTLAHDAARGVRKVLVWGTPGASSPRHDHTGDEVILVLEGRLRDERGSYGPGDLCRSAAGHVHQETVDGDEDCICYVVYYGDLVPA